MGEDVCGPLGKRQDVVDRRVKAWLKTLKDGDSNAYYAFLLLLTPNMQTWERNNSWGKGRVPFRDWWDKRRGIDHRQWGESGGLYGYDVEGFLSAEIGCCSKRADAYDGGFI